MEDHLTRPSPGSAVGSTLDGPPKALEVPNGFTPSHGLSGLEHINTGLHTTSFSASQTQTSYHTSIRSSLDEWYRRNDGPWTGLAPTHADAGPPSTLGSLRTNSMFQYYDNAVPSECSTMLPSDSGYGSYGAKRSVANNSVCDETFDRNTETQSVIGQLHSELTFTTFNPELLPRSGLDHGDSWALTQGVPKSSDHHSQLNGGSITCETCNKLLKTHSELNPTENQKRLCTDDPLASENPPRRFPRLPKTDTSVSFRVNQDTDFPVDSPENAEDVSARDAQTINQGPFLKGSTFNQDEPLLTDSGIARSTDPEPEASLPKYEAGDGLREPRDEPKEFLPLDVESPRPLEEAKEVDAGTQDSLEHGNQQIPKAALHAVDLNDQTEVVKLLETLQHNGLLKKLGYKKESSVEPDTEKVEIASTPGQSHQYPCSKCKKTFSRRCELKKHEKRHSKPYGCTFPTCNKRFGSKNDWKRHENSQHFLLEVWRNCEARFWCGFCQAIIESKQKGLGAWSERFDHIDNHFAGRNNFTRKEISDWKNVDPDQPSKDLSAPDSDDSDGSPSPPPAGPSKSDITHLGRLEKQDLQSSKTRRRKGTDSQDRATKRRRQSVELYRFICCQCGDPMPATNLVCTNFPCDHQQCDRCTPE
ncbi:hypothetical protein DL768_000133 [Monosporascus sp. mg162]|nr:hypothetical protein DL768_000133 [Monosporascus sp. mg162]